MLHGHIWSYDGTQQKMINSFNSLLTLMTFFKSAKLGKKSNITDQSSWQCLPLSLLRIFFSWNKQNFKIYAISPWSHKLHLHLFCLCSSNSTQIISFKPSWSSVTNTMLSLLNNILKQVPFQNTVIHNYLQLKIYMLYILLSVKPDLSFGQLYFPVCKNFNLNSSDNVKEI